LAGKPKVKFTYKGVELEGRVKGMNARELKNCHPDGNKVQVTTQGAHRGRVFILPTSSLTVL
jgi:hypothetical protein